MFRAGYQRTGDIISDGCTSQFFHLYHDPITASGNNGSAACRLGGNSPNGGPYGRIGEFNCRGIYSSKIP